MNGIHDMGGMDGFGAVYREENEPVFHAPWESRAFAVVSMALLGLSNVDEFRHAIERIPPARYLASSYYERWMYALESLMVEKGKIKRSELAAALGLPDDEVAISRQAAEPQFEKAKRGIKAPRARFQAGDRVRARNLNSPGHTRMPRYVRGKTAVVRRDWGIFVFPDSNAHNAGQHPQHVYSVAFKARELWGAGEPARDEVMIDLWEDYLERALVTVLSKNSGKGRSAGKP
ncbi:MAG TPA: nitrile hydratase subunit beta [Candidatus Binataceae bacterium]